jgi:hypothetical protein
MEVIQYGVTKYITRLGESRRDSIIPVELTPEELEAKKRQVFGEDLEAIHPEIVEVTLESLLPDVGIRLDEETKSALAYASEAGVSPAKALRLLLDAIARTKMRGGTEVTVYGPGGEQIKQLESHAIALMNSQQRGEFVAIDPIGLQRTERAANDTGYINPYVPEKVLIPGIPQSLSPVITSTTK